MRDLVEYQYFLGMLIYHVLSFVCFFVSLPEVFFKKIYTMFWIIYKTCIDSGRQWISQDLTFQILLNVGLHVMLM